MHVFLFVPVHDRGSHDTIWLHIWLRNWDPYGEKVSLLNCDKTKTDSWFYDKYMGCSLCLPCHIISALRFLSFLYLILCPPLPSCCACIQSVTAENNRLPLNWLTRCDGGNSTNRLEVTEGTRELWSTRLQLIDILFHDVRWNLLGDIFEVIFNNSYNSPS